MTIVIDSPDVEPWGCLHPAARYPGFWDEADERYWGSVAQYCIARRLASAEDRERVRMANDAATAEQLATTMPEADGWRERAQATLRHALLRKVEANLGIRAVLVASGDEALELPAPWDAAGALLQEIRAIVRRRADDVDAIQCEHQDAETVRLACTHLLASREAYRRYHRRFTGEAAAFELLCTACAEALADARGHLRKVCHDCFGSVLNGYRQGDIGAPAHRRRTSNVRFDQIVVRPLGISSDDVIALAPVPKVAGVWLMLDRGGRVHRVDLERGLAEAGGALQADSIDLAKNVDLIVAPDGRLCAVAERSGLRAVVLEPASGRMTLSLVRGNYHAEQCRYPIGFFELDGRLLLVHATNWNRLEISDPTTGALLTERSNLACESGQPRPAHYLDYFHAGLVISPDGQRVVDNGWVWHPVGIVRTFSLRRWLTENPYESEDGPSVKSLCSRAYFWDGPVCWLDEHTVAVWGEGDDDLELTPAAKIFNVETGAELRTFPGPTGDFTWDAPYLVAHDRQHGATVWDVETGDCIATEPMLRPDGYHPGSRCFVERLPGEGFRVSRRH